MSDRHRRSPWRLSATLLGLVAWLLATVVADAAGLGAGGSVMVGLVVAVAVLTVGTCWLVPGNSTRPPSQR